MHQNFGCVFPAWAAIKITNNQPTHIQFLPLNILAFNSVFLGKILSYIMSIILFSNS